MNYQITVESGTDTSGSIMMESDLGDKNYILLESAPVDFSSVQAVDQSHKFEAASGATTASSTDDILDFSERNPFGESDFSF